jgi:hypothetical protein
MVAGAAHEAAAAKKATQATRYANKKEVEKSVRGAAVVWAPLLLDPKGSKTSRTP